MPKKLVRAKQLSKPISLQQDNAYPQFWKPAFWLAVIGILILAAIVRLWQLGHVPFSLYWDEMAMFVDIKSVLQTGKDMFGRPWFQLIYPSYGDYKLPVYIWLATLSAKIFGLSEWSLRLPSAIAGILTVIMAGLVATELWVKKEQKANQKTHDISTKLLQLAVMLVVAVSPWSIGFSRTGFEGHVGQLFLATGVWLLLKARRQWWLSIPAGFFVAVATYAYFSVRFVWIGVWAAVAGWMLLQEIAKWWPTRFEDNVVKKWLPWIGTRILLPMIVFVLLCIPMLRSPLYRDANTFRLGTDSVLKNDAQTLQSNVYRELAGNTPLDRVLFHRWVLTARELAFNYSDHVSLNFLFSQGDSNLRHGTGAHGLFLWPMIVPFVIGACVLGRKRPVLLAVLMVWWLFALLPASVPQNTPHALRSLNALVPLSIWIGVGLATIAEAGWSSFLKLRKSRLLAVWSSVCQFLVVLVFSSLVTISAIEYFVYYFTIYPSKSAEAWQNGYRDLHHTIFKYLTSTMYSDPGGMSIYIQPFDDRFYLWLMGYGQYSGDAFQAWKSQNYKFESSMPGYTFRILEPQKVTVELARTSEIYDKGRLVVAGQAPWMDEWLAKVSIKPIGVENVIGDDNLIKFKVAYFSSDGKW